jgi:hypothetical protein
MIYGLQMDLRTETGLARHLHSMVSLVVRLRYSTNQCIERIHFLSLVDSSDQFPASREKIEWNGWWASNIVPWIIGQSMWFIYIWGSTLTTQADMEVPDTSSNPGRMMRGKDHFNPLPPSPVHFQGMNIIKPQLALSHGRMGLYSRELDFVG